MSLIDAQGELIIIDTDVKVREDIRPEPPPLTLQPVKKSQSRRHLGRIASSPYKVSNTQISGPGLVSHCIHISCFQDVGKTRSKSMSPDNIDFCPNNWFEVKKDVEQEGFCEQASWKCCFLCVCLPLCYPCYLSRTVRSVHTYILFWNIPGRTCYPVDNVDLVNIQLRKIRIRLDRIHRS